MQKAKFKILKFSAVFLLLAFYFLLPLHSVNAAIVPCGTSTTPACTQCDLFALLKNIIDFALDTGAPIVATLLFLWAGFRMIMGGAYPAEFAAGKTIFWNTVWGLVIVFGAWLVVNTLLQTLAADQNISGSWFKIECHEPAAAVKPGPTVSQPPVSEACEQKLGGQSAAGCADTSTCVSTYNYTTHQLSSDDCQSDDRRCLLSTQSAAQAKKLIDTFDQLAQGTSCTLEIASAIQTNGGPGRDNCHKPGFANSGTCADFHVSSHDACYKYLYQAARDSGAAVYFLDEYVATCRRSNSTGGNVHIEFSNGAAPVAGQKANCKFSGTDLCQTADSCPAKSNCNQYNATVQRAASQISIPGINSAALLKAVLYNETQLCNSNTVVSVNGAQSCGIMQLKPATASQFKTQCGVSADITCDWLVAHPNESICLGAQYIQQLASGSCGNDVRNLAAGYNGGPEACQPSADCTAQTSCGGAARQWECLYDDPAHQTCNTGYDDLRGVYVPGVLGCYRANNSAANSNLNTTNASGVNSDPAPTDLKVSPASATAGVFEDLTDLGNAMFNDNDLTLTFTGKNLDGAAITSDAKDMAGGTGGIIVKKVRIISGEKVEADVTVLPTAEAGLTLFTLKNQSGKTTSVDFTIQLTGTQWLMRQFPQNQTNVVFFGHWDDLSPDARLQNLADGIKQGLQTTAASSYRQLNLETDLYEKKYWESGINRAVCGTVYGSDLAAGGCSHLGSKKISVEETSVITGAVVLHESAHALQDHYRGIDTGAGFVNSWARAVGDLSLCPYLPLKDPQTWKNGRGDVPHCGFIIAYGANETSNQTRTPAGFFNYEDVATMTEYAVFHSDYFSASGPYDTTEVRTDPRYRQKLNLLVQYQFIANSPLGLTRPLNFATILNVLQPERRFFP